MNSSHDRIASSIISGRKGRLGKSPAAVARVDNQNSDAAESSAIVSTPAAAARKPPRPFTSNESAEGLKSRLRAAADTSNFQQLLEGSAQKKNIAESASAAHSVGDSATDNPESLPVAVVSSQLQGHDCADISAQTSLPFALTTFVSLPTKRSVLKSAASMYAASGVVDDLFTPRDTYEHGDIKPMTRARHQFGLSAEQLAADNERQKEFASSLGAWYKSQLQRHARITTPGSRAISRSNSRVSE